MKLQITDCGTKEHILSLSLHLTRSTRFFLFLSLSPSQGSPLYLAGNSHKRICANWFMVSGGGASTAKESSLWNSASSQAIVLITPQVFLFDELYFIKSVVIT